MLSVILIISKLREEKLLCHRFVFHFEIPGHLKSLGTMIVAMFLFSILGVILSDSLTSRLAS